MLAFISVCIVLMWEKEKEREVQTGRDTSAFRKEAFGQTITPPFKHHLASQKY